MTIRLLLTTTKKMADRIAHFPLWLYALPLWTVGGLRYEEIDIKKWSLISVIYSRYAPDDTELQEVLLTGLRFIGNHVRFAQRCTGSARDLQDYSCVLQKGS
ncbi:hypothetical protein SKAU_G00128880 [Synaphobranchus kaupii]|uniref:Uncharacterized protein n=1 Tax=Synaphobranchus kaupii TaxID=118154 RepID=A0A9Q1FQ53_SYNKA|nr:hypothetical protein SKAU_G00128880 [Synaphobranchus kaupii]